MGVINVFRVVSLLFNTDKGCTNPGRQQRQARESLGRETTRAHVGPDE